MTVSTDERLGSPTSCPNLGSDCFQALQQQGHDSWCRSGRRCKRKETGILAYTRTRAVALGLKLNLVAQEDKTSLIQSQKRYKRLTAASPLLTWLGSKISRAAPPPLNVPLPLVPAPPGRRINRRQTHVAKGK